mmetsp:Transcript_11653/g.33193  ORF Transcript_11653/g.33193 Transcript_11653/m.33193 type:complete len:318 (+) Transcript_11653:275-1228(+)
MGADRLGRGLSSRIPGCAIASGASRGDRAWRERKFSGSQSRAQLRRRGARGGIDGFVLRRGGWLRRAAARAAPAQRRFERRRLRWAHRVARCICARAHGAGPLVDDHAGECELAGQLRLDGLERGIAARQRRRRQDFGHRGRLVCRLAGGSAFCGLWRVGDSAFRSRSRRRLEQDLEECDLQGDLAGHTGRLQDHNAVGREGRAERPRHNVDRSVHANRSRRGLGVSAGGIGPRDQVVVHLETSRSRDVSRRLCGALPASRPHRVHGRRRLRALLQGAGQQAGPAVQASHHEAADVGQRGSARACVPTWLLTAHCTS